MSDSETDPLSSLLTSFALGPAWARGGSDDKKERKPKTFTGTDERPPRRDDRDRGGFRDRESGDRRPPQGRRDGKFQDRRDSPRFEEVRPAEGVRVTILPDAQAVHLIGKEVHQVARVYSLFDVAKTLLAEKARCRAVFEVQESHSPLFLGKLDDSLFLTRDEATRHLWNSELRNQFIEEETIEVDPPTGNFQAIARCGISNEWLGPVNFHSYQTNLRRLHRERFSNMPFEVYSAKVRTERGEEAVNAWLETTKTKIRWRIKGQEGDEGWTDDRSEIERVIHAKCFDQGFHETRSADVSGAIPAKNLSPSLLLSLKISGTHARNHPAILIPAVCRAVEAEHLPVFKRQGKLFTGPARPHPLALDAVLAERPAKMVSWIRENPPAKLEGLWKAVLPEGSTAPPADYAADLFWLLTQGHILLYTDDTLVVQDVKEVVVPDPNAEPKKKKKKKKSKKSAADGEATPANDLTADKPVAEIAEATPEEPLSHQEESPAPAAEISAPTVVEEPVSPPAETSEPVTDNGESQQN
ncbi:MAG: hypothetical protein HC845_04925 [Akkermansiaceae bacterium]|nr:hypothetical protein [Akkermansiaceae bacterium]